MPSSSVKTLAPTCVPGSDASGHARASTGESQNSPLLPPFQGTCPCSSSLPSPSRRSGRGPRRRADDRRGRDADARAGDRDHHELPRARRVRRPRGVVGARRRRLAPHRVHGRAGAPPTGRATRGRRRPLTPPAWLLRDGWSIQRSPPNPSPVSEATAPRPRSRARRRPSRRRGNRCCSGGLPLRLKYLAAWPTDQTGTSSDL
jgi:hypothetical protein